VPCPVGRSLKRFARKVPVAVVCLTDRTQRRTAAGVQLTQLAGRRGCALLSRRRPALYSFRLLRTGSAPRSLVICGLLTMPGRRCSAVSLWWPASTNSRRDEVEMKLKLLLDGDGRRQDPTHTDTSFYVVSQLGDPGFRPRVRPLTRENRLVD